MDEKQTSEDFESWVFDEDVESRQADEDSFVPGLSFDDSGEASAEQSPPQPEGPDREEIIAEAEKEAQQIISEAQNEAEKIKEQAQQQVDQRIQQQIEKEVRAVREEQTEAFEEAANELLEQFEAAMDDQLDRLECQAARLVAGIVEKVIAQKVAADDQIVVEVTRQALRQLEDAHSLTVTVHPDDKETLSEQKEQLRKVAGGLEDIQVSTDEDIQSGGCLLDSDGGEVDARIESQLMAIWDSMFGLARQSQ